ncbi:hypothetical protein BGZ99_001204, partial [Dissophora globulifera]
MDPLKQRHIRNLDDTHGTHSFAELDPQSTQETSTQEASAHSPAIAPDLINHRTPSNNAGDRSRILNPVDFTDCHQRTDIALHQAPSTPVPALPFSSAVRPAETISSRRHPQRQHQKQASEWHDIDQFSAGRFINIEPAALQRQQITILRPALFSLAVPSNTAPTVFALASSVPNLIGSQLSMNPSNQPTVEQDPVPFKTIFDQPPITSIEPPLSETSSPVASSMKAQHDSPQQPPQHEQSCTFESACRASQVTSNISSDRTRVEGEDDEIYHYLASTGLTERPASPQSSQTRQEATSLDSDLESPMSPTTLLTLSTNLNKMTAHDQDLDPCHFRTNADQRQKAEDNQLDDKFMIGSRATAFEFAPMNNNGDYIASIQLREESVLRDGHIRLTLPPDGQKTATEATPEVSVPPPTAAGLDSKAISSVNECIGDGSGVELSSHLSSVDGYLSESDVNMEALRVKEEISSISKFDYIEKVNEASTRDKEESIESLVESMDWTKTGLGPRSGWPRELVMTFQLLLKSPSPLGLYWGDKSYMLYND